MHTILGAVSFRHCFVLRLFVLSFPEAIADRSGVSHFGCRLADDKEATADCSHGDEVIILCLS